MTQRNISHNAIGHNSVASTAAGSHLRHYLSGSATSTIKTRIKPPPQTTMLTFLLNPFILPFFILLFIKWQFFPPKTTVNPPPSPFWFPIIGNFHQLGTLPHRSLRSLSLRYGPLMLIHLGNIPTVVASSAEAAREIMKTHDIVFASRPESKLAKKLLYDAKTVSAAPYGDHWRQLKSVMVLQLLSTKRVRFFRSVRAEETAQLLKIVDDSNNHPVNLSELFVTYTNNVTCEVVLGRKYGEGPNGKKFKRLLREFLVALGSVNIGDFIPYLAWVDRVNGSDREVDRIAREIDEFVEGVVKERTKKHHGTAENAVDYDNFVDIVLEMQRDETNGILLDKTNIKALLLDAYTAGTDTTATVLEWVMAELLRHPSIMKKAQAEVRAVSGGKTGLTEEDLEKMTYLKAAVIFRLQG
ncbi:hypothetical protein L6452_33696 [Arctium lappa]|uniref:Uncharacterized protein n=1 Tax=Arctium lappa TaxID=4217 RepID=A0ACB8YFI3_ARCLA|nr:hypothetical protein L6452_33696 [Arctium lappa]